MGNKDNPRRIRNKIVAGGIGVLLLAGNGYGGYAIYDNTKTIKKQNVLIHEYQQELIYQSKALDEQGSLIDQQEKDMSNQQQEIETMKGLLEENQKVKDSYKQEIDRLKKELVTKDAQIARQATTAKTVTKKDTSTTLPSRGTGESVQKTINMQATGYIAMCKEGCTGVTATGYNLKANPHAKIIAVDPRVIPLGTKVWVEGYGYAVAADTGGAIKGYKIDLHFATEAEANKWGRRTVQVKIFN